MSDRVGEVRYEAKISAGNWLSVIATLATGAGTILVGVWVASAYVHEAYDKIAELERTDQARYTGLVGRLTEEARLGKPERRTASELDRMNLRLDAVLQQRRGDAGSRGSSSDGRGRCDRSAAISRRVAMVVSIKNHGRLTDAMATRSITRRPLTEWHLTLNSRLTELLRTIAATNQAIGRADQSGIR